MTLQSRLQESIDRWNLLDSSFYQAWSAGTLPLDGLRAYAREYGAFISQVPKGWQALGDNHIADEEKQHVKLWRQFAGCLGAEMDEPKLRAVRELVDRASRLFSEKATALGALYAFEAQQPAATQSKLEGLRAHYHLPRAAEYYFQVHAGDDSEPRLLLSRIAELSRPERERAVNACGEMCQALRAALDELGSMYVECATVQ